MAQLFDPDDEEAIRKIREDEAKARARHEEGLREGARLRDEGMARADDHANPEWKTAAPLEIQATAERLRELTTDDIWPNLDESKVSTAQRKAIGPQMTEAAKRGWIKKSDPERRRNSDRPVAHQNPKLIWISLIYKGDD